MQVILTATDLAAMPTALRQDLLAYLATRRKAAAPSGGRRRRAWAPLFAGKRFHVRLHRPGLKGILSTPDEERFLDEALLQALSGAGMLGHIGFDDADFVIHIETIDRRAGLSLWSGDEMQRYPFLSIS
jgi:hypothetical protein